MMRNDSGYAAGAATGRSTPYPYASPRPLPESGLEADCGPKGAKPESNG